MKIAVLTWYSDTMNYGSILQAYAMQSYFRILGYEPEFIRYKSVSRDAEYPPQIVLLVEKVRNRIKRLNSTKDDALIVNTKRVCSQFVEENIHSTSKAVGREELEKLADKYDVFVCGSDQIWSLNKKCNPAYFLDWVDDHKIKIAYAPSIPLNKVDKKKSAFLRKVIHGFDAISVREKECAQKLSEILDQKVENVLDPTLLIDESIWEKMSETISHKPYILCYFLGNRRYYDAYVKEIKAKTGYGVLLIPTETNSSIPCDEVLSGIGPKEFVSYIKSAELVLTDSYHASIFSLIFKRRFFIFERFPSDSLVSQNNRIYDLVDKFNLKSVLVTENEKPDLVNEINLQNIEQDLSRLRKLSEVFLVNALKGN